MQQKSQKRQQIIGKLSYYILERISKLKIDRERAREKMRDWSQKKPKHQPLYLIKEHEFNTLEQQMEEERRQQELESRKNIFKRISISEIRKHAREHDNILEQNLAIMKKRRGDEGLDGRDRSSDITPTH
jgi:hypothetical protein